MELTLEGRKALVGGSSRGIGRAIAEQLAASGASVTLMARSEDTLKDIVASLPVGKGQRHGYLVVDFTDIEAYRNTMTSFFADNSVDILVNNTQGPPAGNSLEMPEAAYQEAFELLFKTVLLTTQLALQHMISAKWGRIINVASVSVKEPLPYLALSNTIRAAVVTWAKSLATDVGRYGITVNNVLTGYFDTERIAQLNEKKAAVQGIPATRVRAEMEAKVPLGRIGRPEEYGYLATFLASDKASYITGINLPIDGGLLHSL
jgi:3-oxoacyl-[acyl-carrier protein] reductase